MPLRINPQQGASYLPTHTGSQIPSGRGNLASGHQALSNGIAAHHQSMVAHGEAIANFGQTYGKMMEAREARDADTAAREFFRERRANTAMLEGKDADNLLYIESDWQRDQRGEFLKGRKLSPAVSGPIYDKYAQQYLDWAMVHMVQQAKVADDNSRFAAATELANTVADAPLHIGSLVEGFREADVIYQGRPKEAEATKQKILDTFLSSWAERNPAGAVQWWNRNTKALDPLLGRHFAAGSAKMRATKNYLEDQAWKWEQRHYTRQNQQWQMYQRAQSIGMMNAFGELQQALNSGQPIDNGMILEQVEKHGLDPDFADKLATQADSYWNGVMKKSSSGIMRDYLPSALDGGLSDGEMIDVVNKFANGELSAPDFQNLMRTSNAASNAAEKGYSAEWKVASDFLKNQIAPRGALDSVNQPAEIQYLTSLALLQQAVDNEPDISKRRAMMDITDPNSLVSQLSHAGDLTGTDRTRRAFNRMTPQAVQAEVAAAPLRIIEEWRKKQGLQGDPKAKPSIADFFDAFDRQQTPPPTLPGNIRRIEPQIFDEVR